MGQKKNDTGSGNQKNMFGHDPKGRETILSGKNGNFSVEKPATGFLKKGIKTADEAVTVFNEQVNSSQN
ncbi:MAG: hypothetical protein JXQ80_12290 [Bacteroidales bacterium]|nr:hypothetical protein [Bacteroidales bacterium]